MFLPKIAVSFGFSQILCSSITWNKHKESLFVNSEDTLNDNDMLSHSLTTMMCFLTKEWYGFPAYTVNLFINAYHRITYKEDLIIT